MGGQTKITALDNGPFLVKGAVNVTDLRAASFAPSGRPSHCAAVEARRRGRSATGPVRGSVSGRRRGRWRQGERD